MCFHGAYRRLEMSRSDIGLLEIQLRPWKSTQSQREPSFQMKRTRAHGRVGGWMNPVSSSLNELIKSHMFLLGKE